jgi:hypothetical protein
LLVQLGCLIIQASQAGVYIFASKSSRGRPAYLIA